MRARPHLAQAAEIKTRGANSRCASGAEASQVGERFVSGCRLKTGTRPQHLRHR